MRRCHLFEWEDQPWLPSVFRDFITDQLRFSHNEAMREPVNAAIAARLAAVLAHAGTTQIVDLCAGAGGPVVNVGRILAADLSLPITIVLTDLYPNVAAFRALEAENHGLVTARYESTNAMDVPSDLRGVRTIFTALHHFDPDQVRLVIADAVRKKVPIAVFEPLERTARMMVLVGLLSFLRGFTHAHRVGRMTLQRAFLTYLIPLAPAMFAWDGMVSTLRTYTATELLDLARSVADTDYEWDAGRFDVAGPFGLMPTTFLFGLPAADRPIR
jgi:hypothetical protein